MGVNFVESLLIRLDKCVQDGARILRLGGAKAQREDAGAGPHRIALPRDGELLQNRLGQLLAVFAQGRAVVEIADADGTRHEKRAF